MGDIQIRALVEWAEFHETVALQEHYWGHDFESVVPAHMLFFLVNCGGHALAAFAGQQMVGILIGLMGMDTEVCDRSLAAKLFIASKRMVVLPEYRGRGIAARLKLAQRDLAIEQGIRRVTWTFDPVMAVNAYLNVRKLGVVCQTYKQDYYGTEEHYATLGTSDRLVANWWVTDGRVISWLNQPTNPGLQHYLDEDAKIVNPTGLDRNDFPTPNDEFHLPTESSTLLEIPLDFNRIASEDETLALAWRFHTREVFKTLFAQGYSVTDFVRANYKGRDRAFYVLSANYTADFLDDDTQQDEATWKNPSKPLAF
jgi:chorismate synthase